MDHLCCQRNTHTNTDPTDIEKNLEWTGEKKKEGIMYE